MRRVKAVKPIHEEFLFNSMGGETLLPRFNNVKVHDRYLKVILMTRYCWARYITWRL